MKIVFFTDLFLPNIDGVTTSCRLLARGLVDAGHQVMIVTPTKPDLDLPELKDIEIVSVPSIPAGIYPDARWGFFSPRLILSLRRFGPDLVHVVTPPVPVGITGYLYAELVGLPYVGAFHGYFMKPEYIKAIGLSRGISTASKILWWLAKTIYNRYKVVISPSRPVALDLIEHGFESKIITIPNPLRLNKKSSQKTKFAQNFLKFHDLKKKKILLYVGRLSAEKNLEDLLHSFKQIYNVEPDARLVLIGDGPSRKNLEQLAQQLKIKAGLIMAGKIENNTLLKSGLISCADVFVSCSISEVQPVSFIEAMDAGLPLVLVNTPQNREFIDGNGTLALQGDYQAFAKAVLGLLTDNKMRQAYAKRSRELVKKHDLQDVVERHQKLYESLI